MIQLPVGFDSMFRYITVVSQRAEQLITGAKPRIESRHKKSTLIAQDEVDGGLVSWRILTPEELEAQRQAMVEQFRTEVSADAVPRQVRDVLPTGGTAEAPEEAVASPEVEEDELARLQRLLGIRGPVDAAPGLDVDVEEIEEEAAVKGVGPAEAEDDASDDEDDDHEDEEPAALEGGDEETLDLDEDEEAEEVEDFGSDEVEEED